MRPRRLHLALVLGLLAGCGMYGSLYLEEEKVPPAPEVIELPPSAGEAVDTDTPPQPDDEDEAADQP